MRTNRRRRNTNNIGNYDLSISDLMAALCGIFILILISVILKLNETKMVYSKKISEYSEKISEYTVKNQKAESYYSMQNKLYQDLNDEFEKDLDVWDAEIDKDTLTIRFRNSNVLFEPNDAVLKPAFKEILNDFFPRLISVLQKDAYINEIDEIRIEGHTARNRNQEDYEDYVTGMELSQERTVKVLLYCLESVPDSLLWVRKNIAAIGYSKSRPIYSPSNPDIPEWEKSRRVEFRIKTKAEKVLEDIRDQGFLVDTSLE